MAFSGNIAGARALLFERFSEDSPTASAQIQAGCVHDRAALEESVRRELSRLLNTRSSRNSAVLLAEDRTVLNYGIPDFAAFSPRSSQDQRLIASLILATIEAYEPRLRDVRVSVEGYLDLEHSLVVRIDGQLVIEMLAEPISFPLSLHLSSGAIKPHARE